MNNIFIKLSEKLPSDWSVHIIEKIYFEYRKE